MQDDANPNCAAMKGQHRESGSKSLVVVARDMEICPVPCYLWIIMSKSLKISSDRIAAKRAKGMSTTVRSAKTGKLVTVRGVGALKGSDFRIAKGIDLTKPIAAQILSQPREKRQAG